MHIDYLRVTLVLALCLALGIGAIMLLRQRLHRPAAGRSGSLQLLDTLHVDTRTAAHVVGYLNQQFLVVTRDGVLQVMQMHSHHHCTGSKNPTIGPNVS